MRIKAKVLKVKGKKYISFPETVKEDLKTHSHIYFEFNEEKFVIVTFDNFKKLLDLWKRRGDKGAINKTYK